MANKSISDYKEWTGSQDELAETVKEAEELCLGVEQPPLAKRTLTYYRGKGIVSPAFGKKYGYLHLLQLLTTRKLIAAGWSVKQLAQRVPTFDKDLLVRFITDEEGFDSAVELSTPPPVTRAPLDNEGAIDQYKTLQDLSAHLLAVGVTKAFTMIVDEQIVVDGNNLPSELKRAMGLLGRLCLAEGKQDLFASVHTTLALCKFPLNHTCWPVDAFKSSDFQYSSVNLIDIDHRCPTQDCLELASMGDESNIREQFSFERLTQLCTGYGGRRHEAYRDIRKYIGEHPITTTRDIVEFVRDHNISKVEPFLTKEVYMPLGHHLLHEKKLFQCSACGAPLRKANDNIGHCVIRQCSNYHNHTELLGGVNPIDDHLILSPHLLAYWFGPAIDELTLFNVASKKELSVQLYPDSDACDLSIDGQDIGIDVKSYASPYLLASALTRSIGRLAAYRKKIIAISDAMINRHRDYLAILKQQYKGKLPLDFQSVAEVKQLLEGAK